MVLWACRHFGIVVHHPPNWLTWGRNWIENQFIHVEICIRYWLWSFRTYFMDFWFCVLCIAVRLSRPPRLAQGLPVRWEDERIISLLEIHEKLYMIHMNHDNLKMYNTCKIVNMFDKNLTAREPSTTFNPRLIGVTNIINLNGLRWSRLLEGRHRNSHGMTNMTRCGKLYWLLHRA